MDQVFADTSYYLALMSPEDDHHDRAVAVSQTLDLPIVTSPWVLLELCNGRSAPRWRPLAFRLVGLLRYDPSTTILGSGDEWFELGLALYGARPDKAWSLTDCISFAIMDDLGLTQALTTDHHFIQAGYEALLLS